MNFLEIYVNSKLKNMHSQDAIAKKRNNLILLFSVATLESFKSS